MTIYIDNEKLGSSSSSSSESYARIIETQSAGTHAGGITAGSFVTRGLNSIEDDPDSIISSLSSGRFSLSAGTYRIKAKTVGHAIGDIKARLQNITDSTTELVGSGASQSVNGITVEVFVSGRFTISSAKDFELQMRSTVSRTPNGMGHAVNLGHDEIYSTIEIWKEN